MSKYKGFTLIELMVSISIIAVLSTIGLVYYGNFTKSSRDTKRQADLKFIQSALEDYHADQLYYPQTVTPGSSLSSGARNYITIVPNDPKAPPDYLYVPSPGGCTTQCTGYCLYTQLENTTLNSDAGCSPPSGYAYGVTRP